MWRWVIFGLVLTGTAVANDFPTLNKPTAAVELVPEMMSVTAGSKFHVAVVVDLGDAHCYWRNPGDAGAPTRIFTSAGQHVTVGAVRWPLPKIHRSHPITSLTYSGQVPLLVPVAVPVDYTAADLRFQAAISLILCTDTCFPFKQSVAVTIPVGQQEVVNPKYTTLRNAQGRRYPDLSARVLGTLSNAQSGFQVTLKNPDWPAHASYEFLPIQSGIRSFERPLQTQVRDGRLLLRFDADPYLTESPARIFGLLVQTVNGRITRHLPVDARRLSVVTSN